MREGKHSEAALLKRPVGTAVTALIGLIVAAVSLLVFVFDLLVTPEVGALIASFVVCGMGLTTGLILVRQLFPRREPIALFTGPAGVSVQPTPPAETRAQAEQLSRNCAEAGIAMPPAKKADPISNSNRHKSISSYTAPEVGGALGFITIIGICLVLGGRLRGGWEFLSLAILAGGGMALVLHWVSGWSQHSGISSYKAPVAGGVVGLICLIGLGMVMMRFHFLRLFLGLAIPAGGAIALVLSWGRRRGQNSSISLV